MRPKCTWSHHSSTLVQTMSTFRRLESSKFLERFWAPCKAPNIYVSAITIRKLIVILGRPARRPIRAAPCKEPEGLVKTEPCAGEVLRRSVPARAEQADRQAPKLRTDRGSARYLCEPLPAPCEGARGIIFCGIPVAN